MASKVNVGTRIEQSDFEKLKRIAESRYASFASVIRDALNKYLTKTKNG